MGVSGDRALRFPSILRKVGVCVLLASLWLLACGPARKGLVEPERVPALNDEDWVVSAEPVDLRQDEKP